MLSNFFRKKREEQKRKERQKAAKKLATGSAIGAAIGAVAGVLLAPKSGEETRKDISDKANEVSENIKNAVEDGVEATRTMQEKIVTDVKDAFDEFSEKINRTDEEREYDDEILQLEEDMADAIDESDDEVDDQPADDEKEQL